LEGDGRELTLVTNTGNITTSNMNKIAQIQASERNVFSAQDLGVLWGYSDQVKLFEVIKHYVRTEQIYRMARGIYCKKQYTEQDLRNDTNLQYEFANKLVPNSYVSLWTVLKNRGVVFQYYDGVYSVAARSVERVVLGVKFVYKQAKESVLLCDTGIDNQDGIRSASTERAIGDLAYLFPNIQVELLSEIRKIYAKPR
jgi:hypothetical protein